MTINQNQHHWLKVGAFILGILVFIFIVKAAYRSTYNSYDRNGFYAIFLDNNQVYFGQIEKDYDKKLVLKNIYYIKQNATQGPNEDIALMKLGNEVHGPKDKMEINPDHILYNEELKDDGRVTKAIKAYQQ